MTFLSDLHHSSIGYASNPVQPDDDWDRYQNEYDGWLNDNYDEQTDTVCGVAYEDAWEDEALFDHFMEWRRSFDDV